MLGPLFMLGCEEKEKRGSNTVAGAGTKPVLTTNMVIQIAKEAVAKNDTWADRATYQASHGTNGWSVMVWRIGGYDADGKPLFSPGGHRSIEIDEAGNVKNYFRGE